MGIHHAEGSCQAHQNAQIHKQIFKPHRALVTIVNKTPMHAERMAKTQCNSCSDHKDQYSFWCHRIISTYNTGQRHADKPE